MSAKGKCIYLSVALLMTACGPVPADPDATLDTVIQSKRLRIGAVNGTDDATIRQAASGLAQATGAQPTVQKAEGELLLFLLKNGDLDVVFGSFAESSPWQKEFWFSSALGDRPASEATPVLRAAVRAGENGWIMAVDKWVTEQ